MGYDDKLSHDLAGLSLGRRSPPAYEERGLGKVVAGAGAAGALGYGVNKLKERRDKKDKEDGGSISPSG